MSATSGMRIWRLISPSFSAASRTGTAQRTMSQPAASRAQISRRVACTSRVSVFVMDCTVMGASPPTFTPPSWICRVLRRVIMVLSRSLGRLGPIPLPYTVGDDRHGVLAEEFEGVDAYEVVVERVHHEQHEEHEAELLCGLALPERQGPTDEALDHEEEEVAAVEHGDGQQVE